MSSNAFIGHLEPLLEDAKNLLIASDQPPAGIPGRPSRVAALNRAVVVTCASAWEAYIEEVTRESLNLLRPPAPPLGLWPALNATVRGQLGRFNNPNVENIRILLSDSLGLLDIQQAWTWYNSSPGQAAQRLTGAMTLRHQIAHGVNPRPFVSTYYSGRLPDFFRRLGLRTDRAVRAHLADTLGISDPWPA